METKVEVEEVVVVMVVELEPMPQERGEGP